jgi:putative ABC transport system permease protein
MVESLTVEDADWIDDPMNCPSVSAAAPEVTSPFVIKYFSRNKEVTVLGTNESYADMYSYRVKEGGRFLTRDDVASSQKVVVLGHQVAKDLFGTSPAVSRTVRIKAIPFRVIGVMEKKGNIGFRNVDSQVIVPVTTAMSRLLGVKFVHAISVQAVSPKVVDQATDEIKRELRRRHDVRFRSGQEDDFLIFTQEEQRRQLREVTTIFQIVLYSIAGISLLVGGIGIMNIMLVSVTERTREIGVRMAVGAQRLDILSQFLFEASIISLLGGLLGIMVGKLLTNALMQVTRQVLETYTPPAAIIWALSMAIMTGVISGLYPAYKASRLDPVEALRYE